MARQLKVGIIGQGRSGRDIHGKSVSGLSEIFKIAAVADGLADRRARAKEEFQCNAYETWEEMVQSEQLDLVVNASPSHLHVPISLALLERGIHVLCEKPIARNAEEIDQLREASGRHGAKLFAFQQSRYHPAFVKMREVIDSGALGRIVQVRFALNGFSRRWDWQTLQSNNGGSLMNTGPHPLDQLLQLFGTDIMPEVFCMMDRANTFGDAEDYVKVVLRKEGRPVIDMEISSCSAYGEDTYRIQGTSGGLRGTDRELEWKYFKPEEAPQQQLITEPLIGPDGLPTYCRETLPWREDRWSLSLEEGQTIMGMMTEKLYRMVYRTLTEGVEPEITLEHVRRQLQVIEECRRQNPHIYQA